MLKSPTIEYPTVDRIIYIPKEKYATVKIMKKAGLNRHCPPHPPQAVGEEADSDLPPVTCEGCP